jgi:hypothetical protein
VAGTARQSASDARVPVAHFDFGDLRPGMSVGKYVDSQSIAREGLADDGGGNFPSSYLLWVSAVALEGQLLVRVAVPPDAIAGVFDHSGWAYNPFRKERFWVRVSFRVVEGPRARTVAQWRHYAPLQTWFNDGEIIDVETSWIEPGTTEQVRVASMIPLAQGQRFESKRKWGNDAPKAIGVVDGDDLVLTVTTAREMRTGDPESEMEVEALDGRRIHIRLLG